MKTNDGRKLSPKVMDEIRVRAIQRVHAGESPEEVIKRWDLLEPVFTIGLQDIEMVVGRH